MIRFYSHIPSINSPTFSALRCSSLPILSLLSPSSSPISPSHLRKLSTIEPFFNFLPDNFRPHSSSLPFSRVPIMASNLCAKASFSSESDSAVGKEILVQHLLVKQDDLKLLLELEKRISEGEDLSDLAVEYSLCPSKEKGGMLGWVRKGQMGNIRFCPVLLIIDHEFLQNDAPEVQEFEEAAFTAPLNRVIRCKTEFGWHLLQVLSERDESLLQDIQPDTLHGKMRDPKFFEEVQLIDVREPDEVAQASLPGFQVLPLRQFGSWGPEIATKLDPQKDTIVMCHHGVRSLQVAKWLQTQANIFIPSSFSGSKSFQGSLDIRAGFRSVFNVAGGIHAYAVKADPSIPTY